MTEGQLKYFNDMTRPEGCRAWWNFLKRKTVLSIKWVLFLLIGKREDHFVCHEQNDIFLKKE